jgi:hemerythrin superfamily protein
MANTETTREDVVQLLLSQHREAEQLFAEVEQAAGDARREPFERLVRLLAVHETAEEEVVYPAIRSSVEDGDQLADDRLAEESEAKEALSDLEKTDIDDAAFGEKLQAVKQLVLTHAGNEERTIFPRLRGAQSQEQLESMAQAVRAAEAVAPTHPHPRGPESALGNVVVGPFVGIADRVRDAIRGRNR